jgi:hypothetical protein
MAGRGSIAQECRQLDIYYSISRMEVQGVQGWNNNNMNIANRSITGESGDSSVCNLYVGGRRVGAGVTEGS